MLKAEMMLLELAGLTKQGVIMAVLLLSMEVQLQPQEETEVEQELVAESVAMVVLLQLILGMSQLLVVKVVLAVLVSAVEERMLEEQFK